MNRIKAEVIDGETVLVVSDKILQWRINKLVEAIGKALDVDTKNIVASITVNIADGKGIKVERV